MLALILVIFMCYIVYTIVPFFVTRIIGLWVVKKNAGTLVSLTFDDGPDPVYTPLLLDLLRIHRIKATFFVQGKKAIMYPQIIRQMYDEGHEIGLHNFEHRCHWFMLPKTISEKLREAECAVESITSKKTRFYRPPWGLLNIFDLFITKQRYVIILWSVMVGDWRLRGGSMRIKENLLKKVKPGSIICLHDSGDTKGANKNAPENMLIALDAFLDETNFQYGPIE